MAAGAAAPVSSAAQPIATGMTDNVAGALCYALGLITGILFLVLTPYNQNKAIRFHAFQSIFLNIAAILLSFAFSIMIGIFHFVGALFALFVGPLIWLAFLCLWLYMMFAAYQGKTVVLPIIGPLAQQQA
jgi:uncharacterized membrane protein